MTRTTHNQSHGEALDALRTQQVMLEVQMVGNQVSEDVTVRRDIQFLAHTQIHNLAVTSGEALPGNFKVVLG